MTSGMLNWLANVNGLNEFRTSTAGGVLPAFADAVPMKLARTAWTDIRTHGKGRLRPGKVIVFELPLVGELINNTWLQVVQAPGATVASIYQLFDKAEFVFERRVLQTIEAIDLEVQERLHHAADKTNLCSRPGPNYIHLPLFFGTLQGLPVHQCPKGFELHVHVPARLPEGVSIHDMSLVTRHYYHAEQTMPPKLPSSMPFREAAVLTMPDLLPGAACELQIPTQGLVTEILFGYVTAQPPAGAIATPFRGLHLLHEFFDTANLRLDGQDVYALEDPQYYALQLSMQHSNPQAFSRPGALPGLYCMPFARFPEAIDDSGDLNTTPFEKVQLCLQLRFDLPPGQLVVLARTWNAITTENGQLVRQLM